MPNQLIPTTHVPEGAYVVTVSRRPDQGFVTLDASVLQQETSRFDRLGWKYEVRQLGLTAATVTYNVQAAATSLLEALSQLCLAAEDVVNHLEPDWDPEKQHSLTAELEYADRLLAPFRTLGGEGEEGWDVIRGQVWGRIRRGLVTARSIPAPEVTSESLDSLAVSCARDVMQILAARLRGEGGGE